MNNINLQIFGSKVFIHFLNELNLEYNVYSADAVAPNNENSIVKIIFAENLQLKELKKHLSENIPTIFLLINKDYLIKNKIKLLPFHVSLILPVEFFSFREILNILLTKYSFFKKSKIIVNGYEIDSNQRTIIKNKVKTKLTEKEIELVLTLNANNGLGKSLLLKQIWNRSSELDSHAFETHLHRLRKKINKFFKDDQFILEKNSQYYLTK
jgi:DNA-binding response OmpR family regulator